MKATPRTNKREAPNAKGAARISLDDAPAPTAILDADGRVTAWNAALEKLTGVDWNLARGARLGELGFRRVERQTDEKNVPKGKRRYVFERDGEELTLIRDELPLRNEDGARAGKTISFSVETTDDRAAAELERLVEESLETKERMERNLVELASLHIKHKESESRFASVWRHANDALRLVDQYGRIVAANPAYCKMAGMDAAELEGALFTSVYPEGEKRDRYLERFFERYDKKKFGKELDYHARFAKGREADLDVTHTLIERPNDAPFVLSVFHDVTERKKNMRRLEEARDELERRVDERTRDLLKANRELKQAKERAESANRTKTFFIAHMSHELRTPLNGILGLASLLLSSDLNKKQRGFVEMIEQSGDGLLSVINDVLDVSQIETGSIRLGNEPFELREAIHEAVEPIKSLAMMKKLDFRVEIDPDLPDVIVSDERRVRQLLSNVAANAVKFTERGEVVVKANLAKIEGSEVTVVFSVEDTGIGVDFEHYVKLFEDFGQAGDLLTRRHSGAGLGLSIARRLVELMGGRIWADSESGEGSEFFFSLCARLPGSETATPSEEPDEKPSALYVDDDAINRNVLEEVLKREGWTVDLAENGDEALDKFARNRYHVVLTDLRLPDEDGFEITRRMREHERETGVERTPIVGLSAKSEEEVERERKEAGMDAFVVKSLDFDRLVATLTSFEEARNTPPIPDAPRKDVVRLRPVFEAVNKKRETLENLVRYFLGNAPSRLKALRTAIESRSFEDAKKSAHAMKSSLTYFGAREAVEAVEALEDAAANADADELDRRYEEFAEKHRTVERELSTSDWFERLVL
jgi:PAS domain S-box-containing protein